MSERLLIGLILIGFSLILVPQALAVPDWMSSEGVLVRYLGEFSPGVVGDLFEIASRLGVAVPGLFNKVYREPGEYWNFGIRMPKGCTVRWDPETEVIAITESGDTIPSNACVFTNNKGRSIVWDSSKADKAIWLGAQNHDVDHKKNRDDGSIGVAICVRFTVGSVTQSEVKEVKIEGVQVLCGRNLAARRDKQ